MSATPTHRSGSEPRDPALRVLFVNENLGGHATVHQNLRRALAASHPSVEADFHDVPAPGLARRAVARAVPGLGRLDLDLQPLRYQLSQSWAVQRHLQRVVGRGRSSYDVLHAYSQNAVLLSRATMQRVPTVVSTDVTNVQNAYHLPYRRATRWTPMATRPVMAFERRVYAAAATVVAQSEWAASSMRARYGVPADRLRVIPLGVTLPPRRERRPVEGLPSVAFLGSSFARKGGQRLLRAFRRYLRPYCTLTIVTPGGLPEEPGVRVVSDIRAGDARLWDVLADCAVFAYPTEIDASPNAVLEAMAAGLPVVATRVGAIPEMVEDGVTGVLVEDDDEALAAALLGLIEHEDRRTAMGTAGRERAEARYDARLTTAQLVDALHQAAVSGPPRSR